MKADIVINSQGPHLVSFGCFELIVPGIKIALEGMNHIDAEEILNEWRGELYLDDLEKADFNTVLSILCDYVSSKPNDYITGEIFVEFWNEIFLPIARSDIRYECNCIDL